MTGPALRVVVGGQEWTFDGSRPVTVGRADEADVRVDDPTVSKAHGEFRPGPDGSGWNYHHVGTSLASFHHRAAVTRLAVTKEVTLHLGDAETGPAVTAAPVVTTVGTTAGTKPAPAPPPTGPAAVYLPTRETLRIGRASDNDIVVADVQASRFHAEVRFDGATRQIVDLGSRNGTYVDGRRVTSAPVDDDSTITIGSSRFRLDGGQLEEYDETGQITFDALDLSYKLPDGRTILNGVTFPLAPSSFVAILGPTGAGKSTLAKALTGFQPATSGSVLYNRRDLYAAFDELRRRIGFVPQDDILHSQLTIARALEYGAALRFPPDVDRGERQQRVAEVIAELGLTDHADTPIHRLSGGQRKRTSVAMELLTKPALLFLDEPTSGLDPGYERSVMLLLRELADGGRSVIVITHSVQSLKLCDRLLFLAKGGFTAYFGPPGESLGYFGSDDYPDVFRQLEEQPGPEARAEFEGHAAHHTYVAAPLAERSGAALAQGPGARLSVAGIRPRSELLVLIRRYLAVIAADRRNLRLLIAQAPLIALLVWSLAPRDALAPGSVVARGSSSTVLLALTLGAAFMGLSNSIREIVKELPVYSRERAIGVSIGAYLGSKAIVLGVITVLQAALLVTVGTLRQGRLSDGVTSFASARVELFLAVALTGLAAMALGLLISASVTNADKALTLLPVVLLGLFLLSGPLFNLRDRPGLRELSYVTSSRWGFSALASTADLRGLRGCKPAECQPSWEHNAETWSKNMAGLAGLTVVPLGLATVALRLRDPLRSWKRTRARGQPRRAP